jgi:hypothetical protein
VRCELARSRRARRGATRRRSRTRPLLARRAALSCSRLECVPRWLADDGCAVVCAADTERRAARIRRCACG